MRHSHYGDLQGELRGQRLGVFQARLVAVAGDPVCTCLVSAVSLRLCAVQGDRVALVAVGPAVRRRAAGIDAAARRIHRPVLEGDRLVRAGILRARHLFRRLRRRSLARYRQDSIRQARADMLSKNIPLLIMTVIGYLALVLSLNVVIRLYLLRDLWATVLQHRIRCTTSTRPPMSPQGAISRPRSARDSPTASTLPDSEH